jgi:hypothetical protein
MLNFSRDSCSCRSDAEDEIGALRHYTTVCVDEANFHLGDDVYVKVKHDRLLLALLLIG